MQPSAGSAETVLTWRSTQMLWRRMQQMMSLFILCDNIGRVIRVIQDNALEQQKPFSTPVETALQRLPKDSPTANQHAESALNVHPKR